MTRDVLHTDRPFLSASRARTEPIKMSRVSSAEGGQSTAKAPLRKLGRGRSGQDSQRTAPPDAALVRRPAAAADAGKDTPAQSASRVICVPIAQRSSASAQPSRGNGTNLESGPPARQRGRGRRCEASWDSPASQHATIASQAWHIHSMMTLI